MKKLVLKISMHDDDAKRKALKIVASFSGIDSISVDMKERKMTIIGTVDPTKVVSRLRKYWTTELLTVGPAKEPEIVKPKDDEKKKADDLSAGGADKNKPTSDNEAKKEDDKDKKSQPVVVHEAGGVKKEEGGGKKEGETVSAAKMNSDQVVVAEVKKVDPVLEMVSAYRAYNPHMTRYYHAQSIEENPNACVIC